ncbi:MAG: hypothetical protein HW392_807 [Steroidobacteraceae bacterium]|nr:hypothetical protein [Steroidobacteraceae bacterium]
MSTILKHDPLADRGLRLLLDPYLCFGPGTEPIAPTIAAIAARSAALGLALCVEERSWTEAGSDPDVVRRGVDLSRFEPLTRIADLPLPSARDLKARFMPARSELDKTDLRLLGALHARRAELLVADDGRLHRLAKRAGLGARVITPWDTLAWLDSLAGRPRELIVAEAELPAVLADPAVARMLAEDCEPFDPYLTVRLEAAGSRMLVASEGGITIAIGLLVPEAGGLTLAALASADTARGHRALEPIVATALTTARRLRIALTALVPLHQDHALLLLDQLGFERRGRDRHGREIFCHALDDAADSPIRNQLLRTSSAHEPADGNLLLFYHQHAADQIRSASITAAARITSVQQARNLPELLALTAGRDGASMTRQREMLDAGMVSVMDLRWLGRLARPLALSALIERGIIASTPAGALRLEPDALHRLAPELVLA